MFVKRHIKVKEKSIPNYVINGLSRSLLVFLLSHSLRAWVSRVVRG